MPCRGRERRVERECLQRPVETITCRARLFGGRLGWGRLIALGAPFAFYVGEGVRQSDDPSGSTACDANARSRRPVNNASCRSLALLARLTSPAPATSAASYISWEHDELPSRSSSPRPAPRTAASSKRWRGSSVSKRSASADAVNFDSIWLRNSGRLAGGLRSSCCSTKPWLWRNWAKGSFVSADASACEDASGSSLGLRPSTFGSATGPLVSVSGSAG